MNNARFQAANAQMSELNAAIAKNLEKHRQAETKVKSLGPDARTRLAEIKLAMEGELHAGRGTFTAYDDLLDKISQAEEDAKEREKAWAVWHSCRVAAKGLEARRENARLNFEAARRAK
jgi:hypothetical protein